MSITSFNMLKTDRENNVNTKDEITLLKFIGKIFIKNVDIIIITQRINTNVNLWINNLQNFLYLFLLFLLDSFGDLSNSNLCANFSGTIKITPKVIAKKILITVNMSLIKLLSTKNAL